VRGAADKGGDVMSMWGESKRFLVPFVQLAGWSYFFSTYVASFNLSVGPSMEPTLHATGNVMILEHISRRMNLIKSGDVVIARSPSQNCLLICKRVRAVGGEKVVYKDPCAEERIQETVVPQGQVWLEGDNPSHSKDSRMYGPVPLALVRGKVVFSVWPPSHFGRVQRKSVNSL